MKAEELRYKLMLLIRDHGDLDVVDEQDEEIDVEFVDDPPAFVVT